ncbi:MAG: MATE family efflux transporter [Oscillospiraceae bacterium]|nr:MATE family efflux transporter [Oscillospiraceae bacterium]
MTNNNAVFDGKLTANNKLISRSFRSLMMTMMFAGVVAMAGSFIDGVVIGNVMGQQSMAAFSYASPVFLLIASLAGIFANGGKALCSQYIGEEKYGEVRKNFTMAGITVIVLGLVITAVCMTLSTPIAMLLGARDDLVPLAADYIFGLGIGAVPIMLMQLITSYLCLDNAERLCFFGAVCMTVVNIGLDLLFSMVWQGGLLGMGLATSLSYVAALLLELVYFFRKDRLLRLSHPGRCGKQLLQLTKTGLPSAVSRVCFSVANILLNSMLFACAGAAAVSAFSVQSTVNMFVSAIFAGVTSEISVFAGIFYGERNKTALKASFLTACKYGLILSVILGVIIFAFAPQLAGLILKSDGQTLAIAANSLRFLSISLPTEVLSMTLIYYYLSTDKVRLSHAGCLLHNLILVILPALVLKQFMGINGIWLSALMSGLLLYPTMLPLLHRYGGGSHLERWMALPKDFIPADQRVFEVSITNEMNQVMASIDSLRQFCQDNGVDEERTRRICLSMEEIVGNIVHHGSKKPGQVLIDIRFTTGGTDACLSVRDNGVKFNPLSYQNRSSQYGLQMIRGITKKMTYCYTTGMNNLNLYL